ncbi:hypothetical protein [Enterobacter ludwigii]|uniref:hypothetical protein n=1 Tax=Enterobacter ludwigii TaxID=299767 RepID=UPI00397713F7
MIGKNVIIVIGLCCLSACTVPARGTSVAAEKDMRTFFIAHPEYTESSEKEALLYVIFEDTLNKPESRNQSLLQILEVSHRQFQVLNEFNGSK